MSLTTRAITWKYLVEPESARLLVRLIREMGFLARAHGVEVTDRSVLPVSTICRGSESEAAEAVLKAGREQRNSSPEHRMSALQDLEAERPVEIEETLGDALRKAEKSGLCLPLLDCLYHLTAVISRKERGRQASRPSGSTRL